MSPVPTPSESPLQKSGFSCKTNAGAQEGPGAGWVHVHPVSRAGPTTVEDATKPFLVSKGVGLTELC